MIKSHISSHSFRELLLSLNFSIESKLISNLKQAKYFSLYLDESTDSSRESPLICYVTYLKHPNNIIVTQFLKNFTLKEQNADYIYKTLYDYFNFKSINIKNIYCFCSAGAPTIISDKDGVFGKIKKINPHIIGVHCIAHRLALISKDAFKNFTDLVMFESTLKSIISYFSKSSNV